MRAVAALAALVAGLLAGAATAHAHADLIGVDPLDGAMLIEIPDQIVLTFSEPIAKPADVVVLDPSGEPLPGGDLALLDNTVTAPIQAGRAPADGWYTISYQVTSADGHLVTGTTSFMFHGDGNTDMAGLPGAPGATGAGVASSADPLVVGLLVAGVAIALLVALGSVRRLLVSAPE